MKELDEYENQIILGDCLPFLKLLPDKCIDLLLTDPPYGGGANRKSTDTFGVRGRFGGLFDRFRTTGGGADNISVPHGRDVGGQIHKERRRRLGHFELGRGAVRRGVRGDVPRIKEPTHLGRQLLCPAANAMLQRVEETHHQRKVLHGDGRVLLGVVQCKRQGVGVRAARPVALPSNAEASRAFLPPA